MSPEQWPDFNLFPRLRRAGEFLAGLLVPFHTPAEPYMSDHYTSPLGEPIEPVIWWPNKEFWSNDEPGWDFNGDFHGSKKPVPSPEEHIVRGEE